MIQHKIKCCLERRERCQEGSGRVRRGRKGVGKVKCGPKSKRKGLRGQMFPGEEERVNIK